MKLAEKGHYAPPPKLPANAQKVSGALAKMDGMHARTHWLLGDEEQVDGADFYWGEKEVGHIHLDGQAHVFQSRRVARALIEAGLAQPFRWGQDVVVYDIDQSTKAAHALWLFQLSVDRCRGTPVSELLARVETKRRTGTKAAHASPAKS